MYSKFLKKMHPKIKKYYVYLGNHKDERRRFIHKLYHDRCVYCGATVKLMDLSNFQIDHIVSKDVLYKRHISDEKIHSIYNLVPACRSCNRQKSNFVPKKKESERLLNPDENLLDQVFYRDERYYIRISDGFKENDDIKAFYQKLQLGNQIKRMDYLLMQIDTLLKELKSPEYLRKHGLHESVEVRKLIDTLRDEYDEVLGRRRIEG